MKYLIGIAVLALLVSACGADSPAAPTPVVVPQIPACQANNTASVFFSNRSGATTQDIFWDGLKYFTLTPGQTSTALIAAAGTAHQWRVQITNTNVLACQVAEPVPAQCSAPTYICSFP